MQAPTDIDRHELRVESRFRAGAAPIAMFSLLDLLHPDIRRLVLASNSPGDDGMRILIHGLNTFRADFASPIHGAWGLTELCLIDTELTDVGLRAVLEYACRDQRLRKLDIRCNMIDLERDLDGIISALNRSHLTEIHLDIDDHIARSPISHLFSGLHAPNLERLLIFLTEGAATLETAKDIASFLASPRSRGLTELYLHGHHLTDASVEAIADAIKDTNYTVQYLAFTEHDGPLAGRRGTVSHVFPYDPVPRPPNPRLISFLDRNRALARRVQQAALRCLPHAQILLNALPAATGTSISDPSSPSPHFPLLRLPLELISLIIRFTSGDPVALSQAQFLRLLLDATGKEGLRRAIQSGKELEHGWPADENDPFGSKSGPAEAWLKSGGWDRWEKE